MLFSLHACLSLYSLPVPWNNCWQHQIPRDTCFETSAARPEPEPAKRKLKQRIQLPIRILEYESDKQLYFCLVTGPVKILKISRIIPHPSAAARWLLPHWSQPTMRRRTWRQMIESLPCQERHKTVCCSSARRLSLFLPSRDDRNVVHGGRPRLFFSHFFREVSSKSSFSEVTTSAGGICFCSVCTAMCCPEHNEKGWKANASQWPIFWILVIF